MKLTLTSLGDLAALDVDEIIDVRSPAEFALDHIPGAINLPVLDNDERARVGTIYVQDSRFRARKIGAALVSRNAARHLENQLADRDGAWRPLVYCWRGGQRSGAFATILEQVGWRVSLLEGGYQSYRRLVHAALYEQPFPAPVILLDGNTGTAKTALLARLRNLGVQVLDLEGLANHRGSIFGGMAGGQPDQKGFESALAGEQIRLDPSRPVVIEAESSKIGDRTVPPALWRAMSAARRITISAPLAERARFLARAYHDLSDDPASLIRLIERLRGLQPSEVIETWLTLAAAGQTEALAADLMARHYDPRYRKQRGEKTDAGPALALDDLSDAGLDRAASRLARLIEAA